MLERGTALERYMKNMKDTRHGVASSEADRPVFGFGHSQKSKRLSLSSPTSKQRQVHVSASTCPGDDSLSGSLRKMGAVVN